MLEPMGSWSQRACGRTRSSASSLADSARGDLAVLGRLNDSSRERNLPEHGQQSMDAMQVGVLRPLTACAS